MTSLARLGRYSALAGVHVLVLLTVLGIIASIYRNIHFSGSGIDEILFYMTNGIESTGNSSNFTTVALANLPLLVIMYGLLAVPISGFLQRRVQVHITLRRGRTRSPFVYDPALRRLRQQYLYAGILFLASAVFLLNSFHVLSYVASISQSSRVFEEHYVDPRSVGMEFPDQKRNLVYIYMESMENTVASIKNGGRMPTSRIPELEDLALDNTSFSNTASGLGGAQPATGTTWTVAGMVAQSAGVPLSHSLFNTDNGGETDFTRFIPGAYTIGDVLHEHGYNQSFLMGSDAAFGGRDKLLQQHGDVAIRDLDYYKSIGELPEEYHVWWGFEDSKLFQFAREEAMKLASEDAPFSLSILTANTHFTDGYVDSGCAHSFERQYDDVHACSSAQVVAFVRWIQSQPFGANTTIVLIGDHLGMQTLYYDDAIGSDGYTRTVYNAFVNSSVTTTQTHNRAFTTFDMYPSTLAAMGVKIEGDRLGLGVNLFSDLPTLLETYGGDIDALNAELSKRSSLYESSVLRR